MMQVNLRCFFTVYAGFMLNVPSRNLSDIMTTRINALKKRVTISSDIHYTDITAFSDVGNVPYRSISLFHLINGSRVKTDFTAIDTNNDNLIDRIEWVVPHLSEQIYDRPKTLFPR